MLTREHLRALLRAMVTQRMVDNRGFQLNRQGKIAIAMGSEGHEAVQAGAGMAFARGRDVLYPYYRNTGLLLACGFPLRDIFRSHFARATSRNRGRQIINHVSASELGIASFSSSIAAHCTHAVGTAYAFKLRAESDRVVFCQFGDGATSEGEWHEAMNFAAIHKLPVLFLCENNRWAISTPQSKQMAIENIADRGTSYGMPGSIVDGFDPVTVYDAVHAARMACARGDGPLLIEAKCYRLLSHTSDDDERTYRSREEVERYRARDPVRCFEKRLLENGTLTEPDLLLLRSTIAAEIDLLTDAVEREPLPQGAELFENVYEDTHATWI